MGIVTVIACITDGTINLINTYLCGESAEITLFPVTHSCLASQASSSPVSLEKWGGGVKCFLVGMQKTQFWNIHIISSLDNLEKKSQMFHIENSGLVQ